MANYCSQTPSGIFNTANRIGTGSYDLAGNQLLVAGSNLSYDAENRITSAAQPGIGTVTYTYDGDGQRVMKAVSTGLQTVYVYDIGGKLVAEYSSGATSVPPCHTCFLSTDHLGSTRLVTDENGNTVSRHDYIPFGEEIQANSGGRDGTFGTFDFVNQKFTGKERDSETSLDFFGARYMSSAQGRFTSPDILLMDQDPANPQSWNLYSYVRNNPLSNVDPSGLKCVQTNNGPADDGTGGGCDAAGVDQNGNITAQQFTVNDIGQMFVNDGGVINILGPNGERSPYREASMQDTSEHMLLAAGIGKGVSSLLNGLFTRSIGESLVYGARGAVSRSALEAAANSGGPTVRVFARLSGSPQAGRALSTATGDAAEALANSVPASGPTQLYTAEIPKALINLLDRAGLVRTSTTMMGGTAGTEMRFLPAATEFVTKFFK